MSLMNIFGVSGSAVSAQSQRLNVVASNLANADAVAGPDGTPYKARQVVFQTELMGTGDQRKATAGVRVSTITESQAPGRRVRRHRASLAATNRRSSASSRACVAACSGRSARFTSSPGSVSES